MRSLITKSDVPVSMWITEHLSKPVRTAVERAAGLPSVRRVAVMPDVHLGDRVCVGLVLATNRFIYPAAVGGDIGCGITTIALEGDPNRLRDPAIADRVLTALSRRVPWSRHASLIGSPELDDTVHPERLSSPDLRRLALRMGRVELATLGRGNHFLEIQAGDDGRVWVMTHSGSRAMGQAVTAAHTSGSTTPNRWIVGIDAETNAGQAYLEDAAWCERYAALNRTLMTHRACEILADLTGFSIVADSLIDTCHNHVRFEDHFGERLFIHRKGASPASDGQPGLIPGSMGRESYHVEGRGVPESLRSSSHGAGRAMSRSVARREVSVARLGKETMGVAFDRRLRTSLCEEAPAAYKDIRSVMRAQRDLTRIKRIVRGLICYKGV